MPVASYPGNVVEFESHVDFTEVIWAAIANSIQLEITAIETVLGTLPAGTAATVKDRIAAIETSVAALNAKFSSGGLLPESGVSGLVAALAAINSSLTTLSADFAQAVVLSGAQTLTGAKTLAVASGLQSAADSSHCPYFILHDLTGDAKYLRVRRVDSSHSAFEIVDANPSDPSQPAMMSLDTLGNLSVYSAWQPIKDWTTLTPQGSWVAIGSGPRYMKDAAGVVRLSGAASQGNGNNVVKLPSQYAPTKPSYWVASTPGNDSFHMEVDTTGQVMVFDYPSSSSHELYLDHSWWVGGA